MCFSSVNSTIFANVFGRFCHVFSVTKFDDHTLFIPIILRNDGYLNLLDIYIYIYIYIVCLPKPLYTYVIRWLK